MNALTGWGGKATVEFHEPMQLRREGELVHVAESDHVRIEGGWVHIVVGRDDATQEAQVLSVSANLVARVDWKIPGPELGEAVAPWAVRR
jgi:hypothetical protein